MIFFFLKQQASFEASSRLAEVETFRWSPLEACGHDDKKRRSEALLLGFEDDEEGAGFADNTEENGLA